MTAAEALAEARLRLAAAGVPDAAADARALLDHAAGGRPDPGTQLAPDVALRFEAALAARLARQPVSQIRGWRDFWKHRFRVTPDVLDPRPDTETLVAEALTEPFARVLDLGTGSGVILVSLLAERPAATGTGTDVSPAALAVAQDNAKMAGVAARAAFLLSDWFSGVSGRFDLIVSNPPYIAADEMSGLAPEVRDWEPHLALTPGGDGLGAYRAIAAGMMDHLTPGGRLLLEIGPAQGAAVMAILAGAGLVEPRVLTDLDGRDRIVAARREAGQGGFR